VGRDGPADQTSAPAGTLGTAPAAATPVSPTGGRVRRIATFVFRLQAPRRDFALTLSDEERAIMGRHAAHWQPYVESGQMVVF
jgi:hypothetical protein